jgi:hypothetical protein
MDVTFVSNTNKLGKKIGTVNGEEKKGSPK